MLEFVGKWLVNIFFGSEQKEDKVSNGKLRAICAWPGFRWLAVVILLIGYAFVSQGWLSGEGEGFNLMNAVGSLLLIVNSLAMKPRDWAVAVFNMVWLGIAVMSLVGSLPG